MRPRPTLVLPRGHEGLYLRKPNSWTGPSSSPTRGHTVRCTAGTGKTVLRRGRPATARLQLPVSSASPLRQLGPETDGALASGHDNNHKGRRQARDASAGRWLAPFAGHLEPGLASMSAIRSKSIRDPEWWRSISHQRKIVRTVEVLRLEVVACRETRAPRETAAGYS